MSLRRANLQTTMRLLLLADQTPQTAALQFQLGGRGYSTTVLGAVRFTTGKVTARQLRRTVLKEILKADGVALTDPEADPMQMARVAILCQWVGVHLFDVQHMPPAATEDELVLRSYAFRIPTTVPKSGEPPSPSWDLLRGVRDSMLRQQRSQYDRR
jgi:hypothetical protein